MPSDALLFFSWADVVKLKSFAEVEGNQRQSAVMLRKLDRMGDYGDLKTCRRRFLLDYFSETLDDDCGNCDNCNTVFERFDGTILAQKALSAVYRTGQHFGMSYLIDFLRGSHAKRIRDEHKNIKTYGVGADISKDDWFEYFKDLIAQGLLAQSKGEYPIILFTDKSMDVLKGKTSVQLIKIAAKEVNRSDAVLDQYPQDLFDYLRNIRTSIAKLENVPPYIVFSDVTLAEMATYLPHDETDMKRISGIGDVKFEKFGSQFLAEILNYCAKNDLTSRIGLKSRTSEKRRTKSYPNGKDTYRTSLDMFLEGRSVSEIATERGLANSTIENHLIRFIPTGEVTLDQLVSIEKVEPIRKAILTYGGSNERSPIKDSLGDDYSYGEIRAVMSYISGE